MASRNNTIRKYMFHPKTHVWAREMEGFKTLEINMY